MPSECPCECPLNAPEALLDDYEQHPDRFKHRFGMTPTDFRKAKA